MIIYIDYQSDEFESADSTLNESSGFSFEAAMKFIKTR